MADLFSGITYLIFFGFGINYYELLFIYVKKYSIKNEPLSPVLAENTFAYSDPFASASSIPKATNCFIFKVCASVGKFLPVSVAMSIT